MKLCTCVAGIADVTGPAADVEMMVGFRRPPPLLPHPKATASLNFGSPPMLTQYRALQGYAMPNQIVSGIHTRLWARSFIVADASDPRCASPASRHHQEPGMAAILVAALEPSSTSGRQRL